MLSIAFQALLDDVRRTLLFILTIALLAAAVTAPLALGNSYGARLSSLVPPVHGRFLLITNATASSHGTLQYSLSRTLPTENVRHLLPYVLFDAHLAFAEDGLDVRVRGVEPDPFYEARRVQVEGGRLGKGGMEASVGSILARRLGLQAGDGVHLTVDGRTASLRVIAITDSRGPSDAEVLVTIGDAWLLKPELRGRVSALEVYVEDPLKLQETALRLTGALPGSTVTPQQQLTTIASGLLQETHSTIRAWSVPIYFLVFAALCVVSLRVARASERDLAVLKALGLTRRRAASHLTHRVLLISSSGAVLGIAVGLSGSQVAARLFSLPTAAPYVTPFLEPWDAVQIFLYAQLAALLGGLYAAVRAAGRGVREVIP